MSRSSCAGKCAGVAPRNAVQHRASCGAVRCAVAVAGRYASMPNSSVANKANKAEVSLGRAHFVRCLPRLLQSIRCQESNQLGLVRLPIGPIVNRRMCFGLEVLRLGIVIQGCRMPSSDRNTIPTSSFHPRLLPRPPRKRVVCRTRAPAAS
jgi:hypothetical protein